MGRFTKRAHAKAIMSQNGDVIKLPDPPKSPTSSSIKSKFNPDSFSVVVKTEADAAEAKQQLSEFKDYVAAKRSEFDKLISEEREKYIAELEMYKTDSLNKVDSDIENHRDDLKQPIIDDANKEAERIIANAEASVQKDKDAVNKLRDELKEKRDGIFREACSVVLNEENKNDEELKEKIKRMGELTKENKEKDKELKDLKFKNEVLNKYIQSTSSLREENLELNDKNYELTVERDVLNKSKENYLGEIQRLKDKITELEFEYSQLRDVFAIDGSDIDTIIAERDKYCNNAENLKAQLKDAEDNLKSEQGFFKSECEKYENSIKDLKEQVHALNMEKIEHLNDVRCEEDLKLKIKLLEAAKEKLDADINNTINRYNSQAKKIFANLSRIDELPYYPVGTHTAVSLKALCINFQKYMASRDMVHGKNVCPLYFPIEVVQAFIAGMAASRIIILEGMSGTGKSSLPEAFGKFIGTDASLIPVQSSWKDRNDLLGFYNDFKKQYKETEFLKELYKAVRDPEHIHCIILDEMNLSRVEYYFADFLSILERNDGSDKEIELISDFESVGMSDDDWPELIKQGRLRLTDNIWFIGTANKDDSTFTITDKVYDRASVLNFESKGVRPKDVTMGETYPIGYRQLSKLFDNIHFSDDDRVEFNDLISSLEIELKNRFSIGFGNRIQNQLESFVPAFVACGGSVEKAVDMMFSRKILRKLEGLYDEDTKKNLQQMLNEPVIKKLPKSQEHINSMIKRIC